VKKHSPTGKQTFIISGASQVLPVPSGMWLELTMA
jgi:hypothetical protein